MIRLILLTCMTLTLTACEVWNVNPQPFPVWTAIPSRTPGILSPTPVIQNPSLTVLPITVTPAVASVTPSATPPPSATSSPTPFQKLEVVILGCNTGIDISHGMGEVTNAYVILKNTGTIDLPDSCGLLRAVDEDREHPDKKRCVEDLPAGYQVTLKLTVDSAYKQDTVIQVDASSNGQILMRVDQPSCQDMDIIGPIPGDIGVVKPIPP